MTRWEKWLSQQDNRADTVCKASACIKEKCPLWKPCSEVHYDGTEKELEEWHKACEEYLDEEVE